MGETPRGLLAIIVILALGLCWDVTILMEGGPAVWIILVLLAGRIAAIVGILKRTRVGWFLAVGFFVGVVILNLMAAAATGQVGATILAVIPACCLTYLLIARSEFD